MAKDYYGILGVDRHAEPAEIKKAYRALSMEHHPDKGGDEDKFKEISEAYSVLSNPEKRKDHDNPMRNMGNPFEDMMRGFGGAHPFGTPHRPDPNAPRRGRNIMMEKQIPLKFFILGGKLRVTFTLRDNCQGCGGSGAEELDTCTVCNGTGQIIEGQRGQGVFIQSTRMCPTCSGRGSRIVKPCKVCEGQGNVEASRDTTISIHSGAREGQIFGVTGVGGSGANGGPAGDLGVKVFIKYPNPTELTEEQKRVIEGL